MVIVVAEQQQNDTALGGICKRSMAIGAVIRGIHIPIDIIAPFHIVVRVGRDSESVIVKTPLFNTAIVGLVVQNIKAIDVGVTVILIAGVGPTITLGEEFMPEVIGNIFHDISHEFIPVFLIRHIFFPSHVVHVLSASSKKVLFIKFGLVHHILDPRAIHIVFGIGGLAQGSKSGGVRSGQFDDVNTPSRVLHQNITRLGIIVQFGGIGAVTLIPENVVTPDGGVPKTVVKEFHVAVGIGKVFVGNVGNILDIDDVNDVAAPLHYTEHGCPVIPVHFVDEEVHAGLPILLGRRNGTIDVCRETSGLLHGGIGGVSVVVAEQVENSALLVGVVSDVHGGGSGVGAASRHAEQHRDAEDDSEQFLHS